MPSLGIVSGAERTTDESFIRSSPGRWVDKRATNECEVPPLDIGVQAIQLSPYRSGVAGPPHTRLLLSPAFRPCACPLALSGPGQAVASESSALNSGLLWRQFTPCVTWRTLSPHTAQHFQISLGLCSVTFGAKDLHVLHAICILWVFEPCTHLDMINLYFPWVERVLASCTDRAIPQQYFLSEIYP